MKRLWSVSLGLALLGVASAASAQPGSVQQRAACCQLTTSLIQDVLSSKDPVADERLMQGEVTPPNIHFLLDTSGSMKELPQLTNSNHVDFFNITTNGCSNPRLNAFQASRAWNPNFAYPVPDPGTGFGSDQGFPNLFQDSKFYGYMYWGDLSDPPYQWVSKEHACQTQVPDWSGARAADYAQCLSCLNTKGYYKLPEAQAVNSGDLSNPNFIFWGRFLNFNPPKYVSARAALKQVLKDMKGARVGLSQFANTATASQLLRGQNPSCSQIAADANAFDNNRASYINTINSLSFNTGTPLARSLLNIGYYFTSSNDVYQNQFGFGTGYAYPAEYRNALLTSQGRSVCWGCQDNSVIIITDGEPSGDSLNATVVTKMRTLNGGPVYCPDSLPCGPGPFSQRDKGSTTSYADDNQNYMLDDVAKLLANQDLQRNTPPVVGDFNTSGKQVLRTYTVGFGINSNLLRNTALVGNGLYYTADDVASLKAALQEVLTYAGRPFTQRTSTLAATAVERQPVGGGSAVFIPRLKARATGDAPWQGFLYRFNSASELALGCDPAFPGVGDLNFDGDCNDTHLLDANGKAVLETDEGFVMADSPTTSATPFWEAGAKLRPPMGNTTRWQTRRLYTLVDTNGDNRLDRQDVPVEFSEANVAVLREYLGLSDNPAQCNELAARLGVASLTPDDCARVIIQWYRGRDVLNPDPALRSYDRPFLLHDIFHSSPVLVEPPMPRGACEGSTQCLAALFSGQTPLEPDMVPQPGDAYDRYVYEAGGRDRLILVGSNGGMLHAFHAGQQVGVDPATGRSQYDAGTGEELWGFIPTDVLPKLLRSIGKRGAFVDGTPMVREVWMDGMGGGAPDGRKQWQEFRTVAVVGTGRGGVHRFALDLTRLLGHGMGMQANVIPPNTPGDFLWMWPQPCDPLALQLGESSSHFAPQPPPVGPVALGPEADDALRAIHGQWGGTPETPWMVAGMPARERWVVGLNGGADGYQSRGRGMALVDVATGHTVWSFFHGDGQSRSEYLRYPIGAGLALADVDEGSGGSLQDLLFDTATVGDYGGQLWTVRFWRPGQWDAATQRVNNWFAARAFRVANLAGSSPSTEALRAPLTNAALNVVQPDTGILRTFIGTGDRQNLTDVGTTCRLGNGRACAEQGCRVRNTVTVERGLSMTARSGATYSLSAYESGEAMRGYDGPSCASTKVRLEWDHDSGGTCSSNAQGAFEYVCDGNTTTWSCRATADNWVNLNLKNPSAPYPQRFYGLWSYGGNANRTFNTNMEANSFDSQLITDSSLVNVGQFDTAGNVVAGSEAEAWPWGMGWYLQYNSGNERTSTGATVVNGCVLWSSFEPSSTGGPACSATGRHVSRLYQAAFASGKAQCASGFSVPSTGGRYRYLHFNTQVNLPEPAPSWRSLNGQLQSSVTVSAPLGTQGTTPASSGSGPLISVPVSP
ncbi:MAG TPA: pilus assembly protein PilY [Myxococcaceae bacterium]|nr:pilus assembly protein PilY [Myxococcaceae bacterium]